jgi:membrane-bound lytic murein transglycosylase D
MKLWTAIVLTLTTLLMTPGSTLAQGEKPPSLDDLTRSAEQWMRDNLDENVLDVLSRVDQQKVETLVSEITRRMAGSNVYDLAPLRSSATKLLPLLRQSKETRSYAEWLQNHLDYFEVAEELLRRAQRPSTKRGAPALPPAPPSAETQGEVWDKQLDKRPLPAGAQTYVPRLKPLFRSQGSPEPLVWLAEVESSFNPQARSPVGALGLFQFMPATARSLGLSLSPQDERLNPEKSGRAAGKYLRYLYNRFGDWRLALAAYNAGETRVHNLLVRYKTRNFYTIAPKLPAETQLYVPKIEATLRKREKVALTSLRLPKT